jgi:hypothetical protein
VALAAVVLLVIAPAVLSAMLAASIALITAAHVVIAVAARWHRPRRHRRPGRGGSRCDGAELHDPGPGLP